MDVLGNSLGASLTVYTGTYDATRIAGTLAAREQTLYTHVLQSGVVANDSHRRTGTCLHTDEYRIIGEKSMTELSETFKSLL